MNPGGSGNSIPPPYQQPKGNQLFSSARDVRPIKSLQFRGDMYTYEGSEVIREWSVAPETNFSLVGVSLRATAPKHQ
jgi:hypothetical protein